MAQRRRKVNKKNNNNWFILILLLLVAAGLYWLRDGMQDVSLPNISSITSAVTKEDFHEDEEVETRKQDKNIKDDKERKEKSDIKQKSEEKNRQKSKDKKKEQATPPPVSGQARMAIILDDFGYSSGVIGRFNSLPIPLTYAVLPYHDASTEAAERGYQAGKQIMLHLPMESLGDVGAESITIRTYMSTEEVQSITNKALDSIPHAIGVNNHQGSKATADEATMHAVLQALQRYGVFFVDSHTNSQSVALRTARNMGIAAGINELFLDNVNDVSAIEEKLEQAATMALNSPGGYVIVIGHARPNTAVALENMIPRLQARGIEFVFVSTVVY